MGTKLTIEEIQERVQNVGWELLTKVYTNSKKELDLKCDKGHEFSLYLNNIKSERVCPVCEGRSCITCGAEFEGYLRKGSSKKSFISTRKYCEECRVIAQKETKRRHYLNNRAKIIARTSQQNADNKEAKAEYDQVYYAKNKKKIQKRQREWERKKREEAKKEKAQRVKKLEERKEGICPVCETTFDPVTTFISRAGNTFINPRNIRKFCSRKCANQFYKKLKPKKAKEKKICKLCGKDFLALRSDKKFCSQNCKNLNTTKARRARWLKKNPYYTAFAHSIRKQCKPPF